MATPATGRAKRTLDDDGEARKAVAREELTALRRIVQGMLDMIDRTDTVDDLKTIGMLESVLGSLRVMHNEAVGVIQTAQPIAFRMNAATVTTVRKHVAWLRARLEDLLDNTAELLMARAATDPKTINEIRRLVLEIVDTVLKAVKHRTLNPRENAASHAMLGATDASSRVWQVPRDITRLVSLFSGAGEFGYVVNTSAVYRRARIGGYALTHGTINTQDRAIAITTEGFNLTTYGRPLCRTWGMQTKFSPGHPIYDMPDILARVRGHADHVNKHGTIPGTPATPSTGSYARVVLAYQTVPFGHRKVLYCIFSSFGSLFIGVETDEGSAIQYEPRAFPKPTYAVTSMFAPPDGSFAVLLAGPGVVVFWPMPSTTSPSKLVLVETDVAPFTQQAFPLVVTPHWMIVVHDPGQYTSAISIEMLDMTGVRPGTRTLPPFVPMVIPMGRTAPFVKDITILPDMRGRVLFTELGTRWLSIYEGFPIRAGAYTSTSRAATLVARVDLGWTVPSIHTLKCIALGPYGQIAYMADGAHNEGFPVAPGLMNMVIDELVPINSPDGYSVMFGQEMYDEANARLAAVRAAMPAEPLPVPVEPESVPVSAAAKI